MRTELKNMYYCDHCDKRYIQKHACKIHEIRCSSNPNNYRDCFDCNGLIVDYPTIVEHDKNGNKIDQYNVKVFYCSLIDVYLIPPKAEHKKNKYILDKENVFMPKKCEAKEEKTAIDFFNDMSNENFGFDFQ